MEITKALCLKRHHYTGPIVLLFGPWNFFRPTHNLIRIIASCTSHIYFVMVILETIWGVDHSASNMKSAGNNSGSEKKNPWISSFFSWAQISYKPNLTKDAVLTTQKKKWKMQAYTRYITWLTTTIPSPHVNCYP